MPFSFGDESANAGDFTTVSCAVIKGDSPVSIVWHFNDTEINHLDGISIAQTKRMSTLSIEAVSAQNSGKYTCIAKNAAGAVNQTAELHVNGIHKKDAHLNILHDSYLHFTAIYLSLNNYSIFISKIKHQKGLREQLYGATGAKE